MAQNKLYYGDNLEVMQQSIPSGTIDLIYLDPPFNSNRSFNVIFNRHEISDNDAAAQIQAFDDAWRWTPITDQQYAAYTTGGLPPRVADALTAFRTLLGENDAMAYLVNMAPRLVELYRVLKSTGSLYLHCDPTMSHYLKVLLDAIFDARNFQNEISWERSGAKNDPIRYGRGHDVILFYTKSKNFHWKPQYTNFTDASILKNYTHVEDGTGRRYRRDNLTAAKPGGDVDYEWRGARPYNGRYWAYSRENMDKMYAEGRIEFRRTGMPVYKRYLDEQPGVPLQDVWTDIRLTSADKERLGYPTQKPVSLLTRILESSSRPGDLILDPFCGCGTTIDASIRLDRRWIGIDVTYISVDLVKKRLEHTFGPEVRDSYEVLGIPRDRAAALALFSRSPFDFERWAVSLLNAQPNQKQVGDKGIDGVARFAVDARGGIGRILISVKGGKQLNPAMVRDLGGTVATQKAEMGVLITNGPPTKGMVDEANHAGTYQHPHYERAFPRIQLITVDDLLSGKRPKIPPVMLPYIQAKQAAASVDQGSLFDEN